WPRRTSETRKTRAAGSRWARSRSESERLMPIYAGIDIGTLTLRLLIARIGDEGRLHELASERRIVRLGEGLQPGRRLQPAPMARALETIAEWMPVIKRAGAREVVAVATSAGRDAVKRDEFLGEIKRRRARPHCPAPGRRGGEARAAGRLPPRRDGRHHHDAGRDGPAPCGLCPAPDPQLPALHGSRAADPG